MKKSGFTLVEIIVVFAIFAMIVVIITNFLVSMIKNNNETTIKNEVRQNAQKIMDEISNDIRNSGCIKMPDGNTVDLYPDSQCSPSGVIEYAVDAAGVVTKTVDNVGVGTLTSNRVEVCSNAKCGATCVPGLAVAYTDGSAANPENHSVSINLTAQTKATGTIRTDFCAKVSLENTVAPRNGLN